jgi:phage terminase large subunit-like protein
MTMVVPRSRAERFALLPKPVRDEFIDSLNHKERLQLMYDWEFQARPEQLEPAGDWSMWLLLGGRGVGKTRSMVEAYRRRVERGQTRRAAIIAETAADARDVIIEGESGIMATSPPWFRPVYKRNMRRLVWPNGAIATIFSSYAVEQLRGPQFDFALVDELAKMRYAREVLDTLMPGLRLGADPRIIAGTTPRPTALMKELVADSTVRVTTGTTYDNLVNLSPRFRQNILRRFENTRLGRQELLGELLRDVEGAAWTYELIERQIAMDIPSMWRTVVGVDPTSGLGLKENDECGIIVAGQADNRDIFILSDRSTRGTPKEWGGRVVRAVREFDAYCVVAEANQGGLMVTSVLEQAGCDVPVELIHATRGKIPRADEVVMGYEQGHVWHARRFGKLEGQQTGWVPGMDYSPDRLDALVHACHFLMEDAGADARWIG